MIRRVRAWVALPGAGSLPLLCLLVATLVGVLASPLPERALPTLVPLWVGLAAYWVLTKADFDNRGALRLADGLELLGALVCAGAVLGMRPPQGALWRSLGGDHLFLQRLPDAFNANVVAGALVMLLPFTLARLLRGWRANSWRGHVRWIASLVLGIVVLGGLLLTESRGALLVAALSLGSLAYLSRPRAWPWVVLVEGAAAGLAGTTIGWVRVADSLSNAGSIGGLNQRLEIWSHTLRMLGDLPLTGVGMGCYEPALRLLYPLFLIPRGAVPHAHNLFLQVAADTGLPGLAAFGTLLVGAASAAWRARRVWRTRGQRELELLAVASLASLLGMSLHGLLDCAVWGNKGASIPWLVLGLCMVLARTSANHAAASLPVGD